MSHVAIAPQSVQVGENLAKHEYVHEQHLLADLQHDQ